MATRRDRTPTGTTSVADLVDAGVLVVGDELKIKSMKYGTMTATVTAEGHIRFGGIGYLTPTAAAKAALRISNVDGWIRWRPTRLDGWTLAELRQTV